MSENEKIKIPFPMSQLVDAFHDLKDLAKDEHQVVCLHVRLWRFSSGEKIKVEAYIEGPGHAGDCATPEMAIRAMRQMLIAKDIWDVI